MPLRKGRQDAKVPGPILRTKRTKVRQQSAAVLPRPLSLLMLNLLLQKQLRGISSKEQSRAQTSTPPHAPPRTRRKRYVFTPATTDACSLVSWLARQVLKQTHTHKHLTHTNCDGVRRVSFADPLNGWFPNKKRYSRMPTTTDAWKGGWLARQMLLNRTHTRTHARTHTQTHTSTESIPFGRAS